MSEMSDPGDAFGFEGKEGSEREGEGGREGEREGGRAPART